MFRRFLEKSTAKQNDEKRNEPEEQFCLVRWADQTSFSVVPQKNIRAPSNTIAAYESYTIDMNEKQRKGTVVSKGTKRECELLRYNIAPRSAPEATALNKESEKTITPERQQYQTASSSASDIIADVKDESDADSTDDNAVRNAALMHLLKLVIASGNNDESGETHKVRCNACGAYPIRSDRYKCLQCDDLDLCGRCFERRSEPKQHKSGHAFIHFKSRDELFGRTVTKDDVTFDKLKQFYDKDVHESISCDGCKRESIKGLRFKCDTCPNYDLCQQCVNDSVITKTHKSSHPLIVTSLRTINQIPVDDIELGDELGRGAFGAVYKARWISKNRTVACKVITVPSTKEAERLEKSFLKELSAYTELSGAYILKTYGFAACRYDQGKKYMLITEFMSRGSLADVIKTKGTDISMRRKLDMARNIASGVRKIHEHSMIHRDIRPDNILVNENYVAKIGDMGIARVADPLNQHTQIGCQPYMPPEFYRGNYDQKLDIFTFGLTLNELFTSSKHSFQPFVANAKIAFQEQSPIFNDLISRCTADDPKRRPTAIEIEKTLDLYSTGFNEIILKKHPSYVGLSTEKKNEIFVIFYKKFHPPATEFIRKTFPREFLEETTTVPGVKVDKEAANGVRVECPMQFQIIQAATISTTYAEKKQCVLCHKIGGILTCDGCQQTFCGKHVVEHRQQLAMQLEEIMQEHNLIQQDIRQPVENNLLLEQIDQWEKESVAKIRIAAEKARADLRQILENSNERLSRVCRDIAVKLCSAREAENFSEIDLTRWIKQLNGIRLEVKSSSKMSVLEDNISVIHLIRIEDNKTTNKVRKDKELRPSAIQERFAEVNGLGTIDHGGRRITHVDNDNRFVHLRGQQLYFEGRHTMKFKVEQSAGSYTIFIGICTSEIGLRQIIYNLSVVVGWFGNNEVWYHGKCNNNSKLHGYKSDEIRTNDVLDFILDCHKRQIELFHERTNKRHMIAVDIGKAPFPWKILLALSRKGDCIRILSNT